MILAPCTCLSGRPTTQKNRFELKIIVLVRKNTKGRGPKYIRTSESTCEAYDCVSALKLPG